MTERSSPTRPASSPEQTPHALLLRLPSRLPSVTLDSKPGFFRPTTYGTTVSSLGIGTYLGESTDADDEAYERSIVHAIASGVNLIDTAINYRSQRSELCHWGSAPVSLSSAGTASRPELTICSKAGYIPFELTPPATREAYREYVSRCFLEPQILHADDIVAGGHSLAPRFLKYCLAKSRQNLGVRTIDVFYLHNPGQQLSGVTSRRVCLPTQAGVCLARGKRGSRRDWRLRLRHVG